MAKLRKILLVEDDELDVEMTKRALRDIPVANEIEWLETGQEFLNYLEEHGAKEVAVVILDLQMPQITGIEALRIIRQKDYDYFPIVVLTSSKESPDVKACYELGVNAFVTKPVKKSEFNEAIKTLGLFWGILNELPE